MPAEPCHHQPTASRLRAIVENCVAQLRDRGLRRSAGLDALLQQLANHHRPATLGELAGVPCLRHLDQATIYRLMMKLEAAGLVRRLGLHERATYFQLVIPGHHHDYLVCTRCGRIEDVDLHCPVEALEQQVMKRSGFRDVYHQLEFFGTCPECRG